MDPIRSRLDDSLPPESYRLSVTPAGVEMAGGEAGLFYARHTLAQLPPGRCVEVFDRPRFAWRGVMLDVARHFMPKPALLRFIDLLALHKLNVLHLHLTDDQGWRLEIKRYPRLTGVGAWRRESMLGSRQHERFDGRPHGGFYTRDDIREIVAYAASRFVTVVPEIDVPGHSGAAIAAYPSLWDGGDVEVWTRWGVSDYVVCSSEETIAFYRDVFDEVMELFPSTVIGIGGDECPPDGRLVSALRIHLESKGRRVFGWDELLDTSPSPGLIIANWRGVEVPAGHEVVACPDSYCYLDYRQSDDPREPTPVGTLLTLERVRSFEPPPGAVGAQCNVWTEHMPDADAVDYMVFPRLCAFADVVWSQRGSDVDFARRLREHLPRLDALGVAYRPLDGPHPWQQRPEALGWPR